MQVVAGRFWCEAQLTIFDIASRSHHNSLKHRIYLLKRFPEGNQTSHCTSNAENRKHVEFGTMERKSTVIETF